MKVLVLYYSRTGNTEKMAKAVAEGLKSAGNVQVDLNYFVDAEDLNFYEAIVVGAPTYNHEVPMDIRTLFEKATTINISLKGKTGATFGSYGWSGEAPKAVLEMLKNMFEMNITENPLLSKYAPDQATLEQCFSLGRRIAETLIRKA
jgi:flavorubredoxin